jgi:cytochrome c556
LGALGGMAQGTIPYDAAVATASAENLDRLAQIDQGRYWLPGTSSEDLEESQALPAIWENIEDFQAKQAGLREAVANLVTAAGNDQASLGAAMGGIGQACGACHQAYREPQG